MPDSKVFESIITYGGSWFDYFIKGDQAVKTIIDNRNKSFPEVFSTYTLAY